MKKERQLLAESVFPRIARICQQRFVDFVAVDFRWGITKADVASGIFSLSLLCSFHPHSVLSPFSLPPSVHSVCVECVPFILFILNVCFLCCSLLPR